ncbi:protein-L-isoaspartate O-methyltransferase [Clostridium botulinum]|uniref:PTS transporter subunit EIIC n=1 Tax=Clostridium TaxID=1485 RepID=UPI0013F7A646|nr:MULTISPECIES: PTS transporter subunit EIIC [Clostridium]MCS6131796.1 protein-L-isoaspartate O-methyltransferase [Clostridium botulinum]NFL46886.1 protein-L-isoaspartate O-methyltransferase [Clostridium botulinum]NFL89353.1 protein-L-isoaspartate O-methyltransferase [Clostridium botulinum]
MRNEELNIRTIVPDRCISKVNDSISKIIDIISGMFVPIINVMSAAGILKGIVAILGAMNILTPNSDTYVIFNGIADAFFYYIPVFLAFTAAKKLKANQYTAVFIPVIMLHPNITSLLKEKDIINFIGININSVTYSSSVIPIILAVSLLHYVEEFFSKIIPSVVKEFFTPLCSILVVVPITFIVFGPIGTVIGNGLASIYENIYAFNPIMAGACLGFLIQPMVILGFHWSLVPLAINNIALNGYDTILALMGPAVFAQAGAALAVFFITKNKNLKTVAASASISAIFGVTEPALFGVNLLLKRPLFFVCLAGGIGGAVVGISGSSAISFAFPGLGTIPVFLGLGFKGFLIGCALGFIISFLLTIIFKFKDVEY